MLFRSKLGHPVPDSNLDIVGNNRALHPLQINVPLSSLLMLFRNDVNGRSVPAFRNTSKDSLSSNNLHSSSVFKTLALRNTFLRTVGSTEKAWAMDSKIDTTRVLWSMAEYNCVTFFDKQTSLKESTIKWCAQYSVDL